MRPNQLPDLSFVLMAKASQLRKVGQDVVFVFVKTCNLLLGWQELGRGKGAGFCCLGRLAQGREQGSQHGGATGRRTA